MFGGSIGATISPVPKDAVSDHHEISRILKSFGLAAAMRSARPRRTRISRNDRAPSPNHSELARMSHRSQLASERTGGNCSKDIGNLRHVWHFDQYDPALD